MSKASLNLFDILNTHTQKVSVLFILVNTLIVSRKTSEKCLEFLKNTYILDTTVVQNIGDMVSPVVDQLEDDLGKENI